MRNLKRVLSLALASVMLIGMMVVGASAANYDDFSDKDKIVNKEAVSTLVELGVIAGKDDGTYDPTGIVTRAEMAKMICVVLNGGKDPSLGDVTKYSYTDTVGHWAAPYIEYCAIRNIVAGKGDGTFGPNETVTGSQAAKMLLVAAGYQSAIEGFTGANWEVNTNVRANAVGLYDGLDINPSQGLTRDSAAQMVYNILDVEQVTYKYTLVANGDGTFTSVTEIDKTADNKTVLEDKFGAVKVEGVVVANEVADLNSSKKNDNKVLVGSALDAGKTKIVITNGGKDEDQNEYTGTQTFKVSTGLDQLGRTVRLYVKTGSSAANAKVFGSVIVTDDNKVVTDASDDSINSVADDNSLDIVSGTKVATNYADLTDLSSDAAKADGTHGVQKILIDNNDDGDVDYVLLTTYVFGKVTGKSTSSDGSLTVNYSGAATLSVDDKDDVVGFDDVAKNDYVLAAFIGGKLHVQKAESVTGTLDAYTSTSLTVDGTKYTVSAVGCYKSTSDDITPAKGYASKSELDKDATFYLDVNGYIVAVGEPEASAYDYAYVWGSEAGSSIGTDRVKVTLSDGTKATYDLDDDSDIDIEDDGDFEGQIFATLDTHAANYLQTAEGKKLPVPHCIKGTPGWMLDDGVAAALEQAIHFVNHFRVLQAELELHPSGGVHVHRAVGVINRVGIAAARGGEDGAQQRLLLAGQGGHLQAVGGHGEGAILAQAQVGHVAALGVGVTLDDDLTQVVQVPLLQKHPQVHRDEPVQQRLAVLHDVVGAGLEEHRAVQHDVARVGIHRGAEAVGCQRAGQL